MTDRDKKLIRNSTAEFLIFTGQAGEQSIEARYEDEIIWLSQRLMAELFAVDVRTISEHLKNIYETGEIQHEATLRKFRRVQTEGNREVARSVDFYNLNAIISVGYRVNSVRATQFRQWATQVLRESSANSPCYRLTEAVGRVKRLTKTQNQLKLGTRIGENT
ncbi:virulence RhuM family protein [Solidesulfovibrio sp.]|uniref:virulence RhuM family protein n=1 Tax=Solidesulfovibrio sp. TaxID=2910990 RepID=UPI002B2003FE|nr:RhuM family protein [Solidesulfovibrio sp.]MEA5089005.1 RhuM family protein [Solidesulfovibrio sp.]